MTPNEKRTIRQEQILYLWLKNKALGTVIAPTGFGKTRIAEMAKERYLKKYNKKIFCVTPRAGKLKKTWQEKGFETITIQALIRKKDKIDVGFLVVDEIHKFTGEKFKKVFELINYDYILCLTGTLRIESKMMPILNVKAPIIDTVTYEECYTNGWIEEAEEYALELKMNEEEQNIYDNISNAFKKKFKNFNSDLGLVHSCLKSNPSLYKHASRLGINPGVVVGMASKTIKLMSNRRQFLYYYHTKFKTTVDIINKYKNRKIIVFGESLEFAEDLHKNIEGSFLYSSKMTVKQKEKAIEGFEQSKNGVIISAQALNEGVDIPSCDLGIITSMNSNPDAYQQRRGRTVRKKGYSPIFIILYTGGTQEEIWYEKSIEKQKVKEVLTINDLPNDEPQRTN